MKKEKFVKIQRKEVQDFLNGRLVYVDVEQGKIGRIDPSCLYVKIDNEIAV